MSSVNETNRQFSLRHIKHETKLNNSFYTMLKDQNLVDVIVSCDGTNIRAHRLVLSANSSYFKNLFESISSPCQLPVIVLKDVPLVDLKAIIEFMYRGEVLVEERQLSSVLKSAELLKVFGLTEVCLALRSRLTHEESVVDHSKQASGPSGQKRPRISDGLNQTTQQSNDTLFSRLSNARFEIRPTTNPLQSQRTLSSNAQQMRSIASTVVKNVILPTNQIYTKPQMLSTTETINITVQPMTLSNSPLNTRTAETTSTKSVNASPITSVNKQALNVQTISPKNTSSSTWTPTQHSLLQSPSTSTDRRTTTTTTTTTTSTTPPIEVIIDDETHDMSEQNDAEIDIKPPIFELNESLRLNAEITGSQTNSEKSKNAIESNIYSPTHKPNDSPQESCRTRSRSSSVKSRSSSTSSQSLPPPPSYRVVQRSSSRLLRNIIRPPPSLSPSTTVKTKESDDKSKLKKVKKDRQFVGLVKFKNSKSDTNPSGSTGDTPEIECPSCGAVFSDEQNWNEHIATVHLPFQK